VHRKSRSRKRTPLCRSTATEKWRRCPSCPVLSVPDRHLSAHLDQAQDSDAFPQVRPVLILRTGARYVCPVRVGQLHLISPIVAGQTCTDRYLFTPPCTPADLSAHPFRGAQRTGGADRCEDRKERSKKGEDHKAMQHLLDTPPTLGRCVRCGALVLTGLSAGTWAGVDTAPLTPDAVRALLVAGQRPYRLDVQAGRAQRLRRASLGDLRSGAPLLGAHACGAHPMDAQDVQEIPQGPLSAPVSATGHQARPSASAAPHRGSQSLGRARRATPRPTRPLRCEACRAAIQPGDPYWGIECGTYQWAQHDACPETRSNDD
jgi:hypothetical protein